MILKQLPNGVRVAMEPMQGIRSVSLGVWVHAGSACETEAEAGVSHFIEHMNFKGTERRTLKDIAFEMDGIGGSVNAFTSKECTCFYAQVLDENLDVAVDLLSDIVLHSTFPEEELNRERGVVLEEILMSEDTPEDVSAETAAALFFRDHPLGPPILGTQKSISGMPRETLLGYRSRHYVPQHTVIACAGSFEPDSLYRMIEDAFGKMDGASGRAEEEKGFPGGAREGYREKDIEQVHITMMLPGCARGSDDRYALSVLSNVIGGSMSSRLFQHIREERGLAYSVYSYPMSYAKTGALALYAGTGEKQAGEVVRLMLNEIEDIRKNGITAEEFERTKRQLKGSYILGMESSNAHMNAIGKAVLLENKPFSLDENIRRMEAVTMDDILRVTPYVLDRNNLCAAFAGRVEKQRQKLSDALMN